MSSPYTRRIPHLGHVALFLLLTTIALVVAEGLVEAVFGGFHNTSRALDILQNQRLQLTSTVLTYLLALAAAHFAFPPLWDKSFARGIHWNAGTARRLAVYLVPGGLVLGFLFQAFESLITLPKDVPMDQYFRTTSMVWFLAFFGTLLAPLFEEIVFRGLLLPAFAIAVDYARLPRDLPTLETWRQSCRFSPLALVVSSIVTSLLFAAIHAPQLAYTWPAVALLAAVSLVLCAVRIRFDSVAASTLVHASYNLSVFLSLFVTTGAFRHLDRA